MSSPNHSENVARHDVVVFGGCVVDSLHRAMNAKQKAAGMLGSSVRCTSSMSFGGVGRNIAEACARLGLHVNLLSVVGDDAGGHALLSALRSFQADGVLNSDEVRLLPGRTTATYTAVLDGGGELCVATAVMSILDEALHFTLWNNKRVRDAILNASWFVMDGNVPQAALEEAVTFVSSSSSLTEGARHPLIAYDPISSDKAARVVQVLPLIDLIKPNILEIMVLGKLTGVLSTSNDQAALATEVAANTDVGEGEMVAQWVSAVRRGGNGIGGRRLTDMVRDPDAMASVACRQLAQSLQHVMEGLLTRYPRLAILCTMGPLGSVVGIGSRSRVGAVLQGHCKTEGVWCFPAPVLRREEIRKVTGAGDSFLSGFIAATTPFLRHTGASQPLVSLGNIVHAANNASAAALTSVTTISTSLSPKLIRSALSQPISKL